MQFKSLVLLSAANYALGVSLISVSDNDKLDNKGLSSIHEGAGINYFFLNSEGPQGEDFTYDADKKQLSTKLGTLPTTVGLEGSILVNGVLGPGEVVVNDGVVSINGTDQFYGCMNTNDPYSYSTSRYMVTTSESSGDCIPIQLKFSDSDDSSSVTSSSAEVTSSISGYSNGTVTTSSATTTTVNTCNEECTKTSEPTSSAPAISSTYDGGQAANAANFGLAGLAIAGALLI